MSTLHKKLCYSSIVALILGVVYVYDGYSRQLNINRNLSLEFENTKKNTKEEKLLKRYTDALENINLLHINSDAVKATLYARASVYFYNIQKYKFLIENLTPNSNVCKLWKFDTKVKYLKVFETYKTETSELNTSQIEYNRRIEQGLGIVDEVCLGTLLKL